MDEAASGQCPVCGTSLREPPGHRGERISDTAYYDCPRCGSFGLTRPAKLNLGRWMEEPGNSGRKVAIFAHALRKMQRGQEWPLLDTKVIELVIAKADLPTLQEQADNLVRWLGVKSSPGTAVHLSYVEHGAIFGVHSLEGFLFLVKGLIDASIVQGSPAGGGHASLTLTFKGWQRFEELRLGAPSGRKAFMAMQYEDPRMDRILNEYFRPAVAETGFDLRRIDDDPRAGLIDDRLRVEIQGASFVIADLSHDNRGAYWEAGYGEGLGKPVIYTCEKSVFEAKGSHFDTNHHLHVLWQEEDLAEAMGRLKATVRATIPEARRSDA